MAGTFRLPLAAAAVLLLAAVGPADAAPAQPAGKNLTLPYPAKAPVVVHVNGLERAKDRLLKMLEALPPADAKQVKSEVDSGLKQLLEGRKLTAVPKEGRAFLVVNDIAKLGDDEPAFSILLPVTGYKEFKESFLTADEQKSVEKAGNGVESVKSSAGGDGEHTLYMVDVKGYVALTPSKETAEVYVGKYTPALSGAMGPDLSASFLAADVAVYVNMDVINDLYGEQIRQFKGLIDFALGQAQMGGMVPGLGKKQLDLAKIVITGLFQAVEDAKGVVIAAEFRPEGLNLRGQVRFADESTTADLLKPETPTALAGMAKLPRGLTSYGASKYGKKVAGLGKKFAQEFLAADDDEKGAERIEKLLAEVAAAGRQGLISASTTPGTSIGLTGYKEPEKAAAALASLYEGLAAESKIGTVVLKEKPKVTHKAVSHRGFTFSEVRVTFDFAATVEALPEQLRENALKQFKRQLKEKTTLWVGTDGKLVAELTAPDWDAAKKLLDDYLDGKNTVGADPGFQLTRKNLPADATAIYLIETAQVVTMLVDQAKAVGRMVPGGGFPELGSVRPAKGEPTYLGVAVTLKPQVGTADLFVPGTGMNVAAKMLANVFRNIE